MKASKSGQCYSQISEFYSSFLQLCANQTKTVFMIFVQDFLYSTAPAYIYCKEINHTHANAHTQSYTAKPAVINILRRANRVLLILCSSSFTTAIVSCYCAIIEHFIELSKHILEYDNCCIQLCVLDDIMVSLNSTITFS